MPYCWLKPLNSLYFGAISRLPRINPTSPIHYGDWTIPPGAAVGMSSLYVMKNPSIFPDPDSFKPDRWLQPNARELEHYLVAFGKGTRSCIGLNLAYAELYSVVATIFRRFPDMEVHETTAEDMKVEQCPWQCELLCVLMSL